MKKETSMEKKRPTIAEELITGFTELADALEADEDLGEKFNCYQMQLDLEPHSYTPEMVKATRKSLRASQSVFAKFLGASVKTVQQWEQGITEPNPVACRFMDEIRQNPNHYLKRLRESLISKNGRRKKCV